MLRENVHDPEIEFHGNKRMDIPSLPDIPAEVEGLLGRVLMGFDVQSYLQKQGVWKPRVCGRIGKRTFTL